MQDLDNSKGVDVKPALLDFINDHFMVDLVAENIDLDDSLVLSGVIDSTGLIELVAFLESKFQLNIEDDEINQANFGSVNKIIKFTEDKLSR